MKKKPTVVDIDSWIKNPDCELIKVVSQGEADAYTRTLEEAILNKFNQDDDLRINYRCSSNIVGILNNLYNDEKFFQQPNKSSGKVNPTIVITNDFSESFMEQFKDYMQLYLFNRERFEKIGASDLYSALSDMKAYKFPYDYVLIDCMPSLGMITINALAAADSVIIPTQPHYLSAKGLELLLRSVSMVKRQINPKLRIDGILMTMVMPRTNISKEITATVKSAYGKKIKVFDTEIPHSIRAVEATAEGKSIFAYDKSGKVAAAYEQLGKEVAEIGEKQRNQNRADRIR